MIRQSVRRFALMLPPLRRLIEQRNEALTSLQELRDEVAALHASLAAERERNAEREAVVKEAISIRDQARSERDDATMMAAHLSADNAVLAREISSLRRTPPAQLFQAAG